MSDLLSLEIMAFPNQEAVTLCKSKDDWTVFQGKK